METVGRKIVCVLLGENGRGKSQMIHAIGRGQKGALSLACGYCCQVDAYVFFRAYQEQEKWQHGSVREALDKNDPNWRTRNLIIMPSHPDPADCSEMLEVAHRSGFDAVLAYVVMTAADLATYEAILAQGWDMRLEVRNPAVDVEELWKEQCRRAGLELLTWLCRLISGPCC